MLRMLMTLIRFLKIFLVNNRLKKINFVKINLSMRKLFNYLSLILCLVLVVSCDPAVADDGGLLFNVDHNGEVVLPPTNTTSKKLSKITGKDDDGNDYSINFSYVGNNLMTITTSNNMYSYSLTYNTANEIINIKKVEDDAGDVIVNTIDLIYENSILTKTNRTLSADGDNIKFSGAVTYNATGMPTKFKETYFNPENPTQESVSITSDMQYDNSNISKWNLKFYMNPDHPVSIFGFDIDMAFSNYDTQKNPFNLLPKNFNIAALHLEIAQQGATSFAKNNARTIKAVTNAQTITSNVTYTYDKDNYPLTSSYEGQVLNKFEYK